MLFNFSSKNNLFSKWLFKNENSIFTIILIIFSSFFIITLTPPANALTSFSGFHNISNGTTQDSATPQIAVSGNNVYVTWSNATGNGDIFFRRSTDGGNTFENAINLSNNTGFSSSPQLVALGNNVYVTWQDETSPDLNKIFFKRSTDNGTTFQPTIELTNGTFDSVSPQITSTFGGKNVDLVWTSTDSIGNLDIFFATSENNGTSFGDIVNLSNDSTISYNPHLSTSENNIHVVWTDDIDNDGTGEILYKRSTNNGTTFDPVENISNSTGFTSINPQIVSNGNDVYIVWQDNKPDFSNFDVYLEKSLDNGTSFNGGSPIGTPINLSNNTGDSIGPKVSSSFNGTNVSVTWEDYSVGINSDILFLSSTNSASSFGPVQNLSNDSASSAFPELAVLGSSVYVTWQDFTGGDSDIFFKSSVDNGTSFTGSVLNLSNDDVPSFNQKIAAVGNNPYVIWQNDNVDGTSSIYLRVGIISTTNIGFDKLEYKLSDTAVITAETTPGLGQIIVNVTSTSDPIGFSRTLTEVASTGIYSGNITFTTNDTNPQNGALHIDAGDTINVTLGSLFGSSTITPRTVNFEFPDYDLGSRAKVIVNDNTANKDINSIDSVTVHVTSNTDPVGTDLVLKETGVNTGIFAKDTLIFLTGDAKFSVNDKVKVSTQVTDPTLINVNKTSIPHTIAFRMSSDSDPVGTDLFLEETSPGSNVFSKSFELGNSTVNNKSIKVKAGDIFSTSIDTSFSNGLVIPVSNSSIGAIKAVFSNPPDIITATYRNVHGTADIVQGSGPAGGGGGLARPSLVLDILASLTRSENSPVPPTFSLAPFASIQGSLPDNIRAQVLNHDPDKPLLPQYDRFDYPLIIDGGGYVLGGYQNTIMTVTEKTDATMDISLNIHASNLQHIALYTNLRGATDSPEDSDTFIVYDKDKPLEIVDPHGYFENVKFTIDTEGLKNMANYKIIFAKVFEKSDIIFRAWNDRHSSNDVHLVGVWQVVDSVNASLNQNTTSSEIQIPTIQNTQSLTPESNSGETKLLMAIKDWGGYSTHPLSDSEFLSQFGITGKSIPHWVTKTTKIVMEGDLTPQEFTNIIEYLDANGIIK